LSPCSTAAEFTLVTSDIFSFFVVAGALSEHSGLGFGLALAVALHNIPEGLIASLPIYYATGSKWKGFLFGTFSGLTEPLGALITWLALRNSLSPLMLGFIFSFVAGLMVYIALGEVLPMALRYDTSGGRNVKISIFVGMAIIALSLVLFTVAAN
jgi:zinc transporter, ZIP family